MALGLLSSSTAACQSEATSWIWTLTSRLQGYPQQTSPFFPFPCVLWTFPLLRYVSRLVTEASPNSHKFLSARCLPCLIWIVNVSCWYWIYRSVEEFLRLLCSMVSVKAPVRILLPIFDYVSWSFYHESANQDVIFLSSPGSTDFCLTFPHPINHTTKTCTWKRDKEPSLAFNYFNLGIICCETLQMELWSYLNQKSESTALLHMPAMLGHN